MTDPINFEELTVKELKERLAEKRLPTTGNKSELVERLFESVVVDSSESGEGDGGDHAALPVTGINVEKIYALEETLHGAMGVIAKMLSKEVFKRQVGEELSLIQDEISSALMTLGILIDERIKDQ